MDEITRLLQDIEALRTQLHQLINEKKSKLDDPDIITASQMLNAAVTKYTEIILQKADR